VVPDLVRSKHGRTRRTLTLTAVLALTLAAVALGSAGSLKLNGHANATLGKTIVINPAGRTLYALSGETSHHLLCKQSCFHTWPPLTVPSRSTKVSLGSGVHGKLGLIRRSNGSLQVTLRGLLLYRFSGDHATGETNGDGIEADGGTWHAATAAAVPTPAPMTPTPPPTPTPSPSPPYKY
jgi:predicted lipoprotein with Yx(FWY)xxD motif